MDASDNNDSFNGFVPIKENTDEDHVSVDGFAPVHKDTVVSNTNENEVVLKHCCAEESVLDLPGKPISTLNPDATCFDQPAPLPRWKPAPPVNRCEFGESALGERPESPWIHGAVHRDPSPVVIVDPHALPSPLMNNQFMVLSDDEAEAINDCDDASSFELVDDCDLARSRSRRSDDVFLYQEKALIGV